MDSRPNSRIDTMTRTLSRDSRYLGKLATGARPFLHVVLAEIERRGLPTELALLPQVESGFNPAATSPKAAAGMWQFIPATGSDMGLVQNAGYDGRRDLLASTRAALDYLEQLHRQFGAWELALAAYNCGAHRVESAQAANRTRGIPTDFWSLNLPTETENYVPRLLAVARLVAAPDQFGLALPTLPDAPQLEVVIAEHPVVLTQVAQAGQMDLGDLRRLNAGVKQDQAAVDRVLVPVGTGQQVAQALPGSRVVAARVSTGTAAHVTVRAVPKEDGAIGKEIVYRVREGESLGELARRFGVSVVELREWNADAADGIREGEALRVFPRTFNAELDGGERSAERLERLGWDSIDGFSASGLARAG